MWTQQCLEPFYSTRNISKDEKGRQEDINTRFPLVPYCLYARYSVKVKQKNIIVGHNNHFSSSLNSNIRKIILLVIKKTQN